MASHSNLLDTHRDWSGSITIMSRSRFRSPHSGLLTVGVMATALVGIIMVELRTGLREELVPAYSKQQPSPPPVPAFPERLTSQVEQYVATILTRPLFSPTRRPLDVASRPERDTAPGLPRLSGVIVSPAGKSAIFPGSGGGKPVNVSEGASIGQYTVRSIEIGTVWVTGPSGEHVLHPVFDPNPPKPPVLTIPPIPPWQKPSGIPSWKLPSGTGAQR